MNEPASLYRTAVLHRRLVAPLHTFVYRLFHLLVDIDRLDELSRNLRWFSHNRFNLVSIYDRDHGGRSPGGLRSWAETHLRSAGIEPDGGRIRLLCLPRICGHAFNPISLWYCERRDGSLRAVIAEVRNTFGERHSYLLQNGGKPVVWESPMHKDKAFHVSPFFDLVGQYEFRVATPGTGLRVQIHETRLGEPLLDAIVTGQRRPLTDRALLAEVLKMPLMTLKVVAGIHWEALKLWLRGATFHSKPQPPQTELS